MYITLVLDESKIQKGNKEIVEKAKKQEWSPGGKNGKAKKCDKLGTQ